MSFRPTVSEITAEEVPGIRGLEEAISFWTGGAYGAGGTRGEAGEWFEEALRSWGPAGFVVRRGEEVLGFAVYGPQESLPRAERFSSLPLDPEAALLAYLEGDDARTRRHLLARTMRDLKLRGFAGVEAITSDAALLDVGPLAAGPAWHIPTRFLSESGWRSARRGYHRGRPYTLMRADFNSIVEVGEEWARAFVGRVKLPVLRAPGRRPAPSTLAPVRAGATQRYRRPGRGPA